MFAGTCGQARDYFTIVCWTRAARLGFVRTIDLGHVTLTAVLTCCTHLTAIVVLTCNIHLLYSLDYSHISC